MVHSWVLTGIIQSVQEINWKVRLIAEYFLTNLKRLSCRCWLDLFPEETREAYQIAKPRAQLRYNTVLRRRKKMKRENVSGDTHQFYKCIGKKCSGS